MNRTYELVILGTGNVAHHLAKAFYDQGCTIKQVYSKTQANADQLAKAVNANPVSEIKALNSNADFYLVALKDDAIPEVAEQISLSNALIAHTSGSWGLDALTNATKRAGIFYPLQTFSKDRAIEMREIPIFIEANEQEDLVQLKHLATLLTPAVYEIDSQVRTYLHLSAVIANNFSNHLWYLAKEELKKANLPYEILQPLLQETLAKSMEQGPYHAQTGPAKRGDESIVKKHLELIENPELKELYHKLSKSIANTYLKE